MANGMSKTQIDHLGNRLRKDDISDDDLRLLDLYRRDFFEAYDIVIGTIREKLSLAPTGRPAKSTTSIADKLRRESIRLSQIQDIAGCRLVVADIAAQESTVELLKGLFENTAVVDRRKLPSHGYRAVHIIVSCLGKSVEIQIRTLLQHLWAELSEKFSDVIDPAIKYGGGNQEIQSILTTASEMVASYESAENLLSYLSGQSQLMSPDELPADTKQKLFQKKEIMERDRQIIFETLRDTIDDVPILKKLVFSKLNDDISN